MADREASTRQRAIAAALHVEHPIDVDEQIERRVAFLHDYALASGARGFVLGISGGQDSTLAGRLCSLAVERLRAGGHDATFVAVRLPFRVQADEDDAQAAVAFTQPDETLTVDVQPGVEGVVRAVDAGGATLDDFARGNVKARIRMVVQYAIAGRDGLLVVGTDHAAEAVTGFFTKHGDGAADVTPLTGLTKGQGRALLAQLGASERLVMKAPTADLLDDAPGQADETELGLTYVDIDAYLEGREVDADVAARIEDRYERSRHKRHLPASPADGWWRER
ncbi:MULTISPECIES: ammonia-dependent NAD(+) synthetase [unclassified Agrococcus]|uniref:ammonia-dependent NAD(+) synthetase n=1 Tax=unclassified Agrococcus TaxID=2615065 RepID=UPI003618BEF1